MRGPGVQVDTTIKDVVVNIDLAPTIIEMGCGESNSVDGISFLPAILEKKRIKYSIESNDVYLQQIG